MLVLFWEESPKKVCGTLVRESCGKIVRRHGFVRVFQLHLNLRVFLYFLFKFLFFLNNILEPFLRTRDSIFIRFLEALYASYSCVRIINFCLLPVHVTFMLCAGGNNLTLHVFAFVASLRSVFLVTLKTTDNSLHVVLALFHIRFRRTLYGLGLFLCLLAPHFLTLFVFLPCFLCLLQFCI